MSRMPVQPEGIKAGQVEGPWAVQVVDLDLLPDRGPTPVRARASWPCPTGIAGRLRSCFRSSPLSAGEHTMTHEKASGRAA
jgi:hypothetical protein